MFSVGYFLVVQIGITTREVAEWYSHPLYLPMFRLFALVYIFIVFINLLVWMYLTIGPPYVVVCRGPLGADWFREVT
jgi:hypothetical protein